MSTDLTVAPVLSVAEEHLFETYAPVTALDDGSISAQRSEDELHETYEIERTADEIRQGGWGRVALQFPDAMLRDAGWVVAALTKALNQAATTATTTMATKFYVLADTSYSSCCVDEIAAEHADAQAIVHYGRSCLSPTARLPVIYVFTRHHLDIDATVDAFTKLFPDRSEKVVLMADVTYQNHVSTIAQRLCGDLSCPYTSLIATEITHDPTAKIPNRITISTNNKAMEHQSQESCPEDLNDYAIFHISSPPSSLLLTLTTHFRSLHVLPTPTTPSLSSAPTELTPSSLTNTTNALLRRRFARVLKLSTAGVIGILVNTLSVSNYLSSIESLRKRIADVGKKSYTIVVGKLNPAKLANFAEIEGWVIIGCWESGLIEDDTEFWRPVVTPFELEVALQPEEERIWGLEWWGGIEKITSVEGKTSSKDEDQQRQDANTADKEAPIAVEGGVEGEESEPPVYDWQTGQLVSRSRPMGSASRSGDQKGQDEKQPGSGAVIKRANGELASVNGVFSPGAEFLRTQRTWQGLGTDFDGEASTLIEEGRSGIARGYVVGDGDEPRT